MVVVMYDGLKSPLHNPNPNPNPNPNHGSPAIFHWARSPVSQHNEVSPLSALFLEQSTNMVEMQREQGHLSKSISLHELT